MEVDIVVFSQIIVLLVGALIFSCCGGGLVFAAEQEAKNPLVIMDLGELGTMEIELFPRVAPNTVHNFISLIQQGYYDGVIFHRVIPGFMIQGGDPTGTGTGGPGYSIKGEFTQNGFPNKLGHDRGVLSMARTNVPDSAGSQFFVMVEKSPHLDGAYAAFGQVVKGLNVADKIVQTDRDRMDKPLQDQTIVKMSVETFGVEYPEPEKIEK